MRTTLRLAIAFVAFIIGVSVSSAFRSQAPPPVIQPATAVTEIRVSPQPQELPLVPPVAPPVVPAVKADERYDLSIGVVVDGKPSGEAIPIRLRRDGTATVDLDLGESIDGETVTLNFPASAGSYRVLQRYRTSMSISGEGPHLDLVDWRHFDSPWTPLKSLGAKRFRTLSSSEMDYSRFPPTTKAEIIKEARRRVTEDWPGMLEYAMGCKGPNDGSCYVSISSLYLRVQKRIGGSWTDVGVVEVTLPMGC